MHLFALPFVLLAASSHAQSTVFHEDFESGYANWSMTGLWNAQDSSETCSVAQLPFPSGTKCAWYGSFTNGACSYAASLGPPEYLTYTQPIVLPSTTGSILLSYRTWSLGENVNGWDMRQAEVKEISASTWTPLQLTFNSAYWRTDTRELTAFAGQTIQLRFTFTAFDVLWNDDAGWYIDDIDITEDPVSTPLLSACAQDGTWWKLCTCGNGGPERGCVSTLSATGAGISGSGSLRISTDTLVLHIDGMSSATAVVFQASGFSYDTISAIAGDGLSCVTGSFVRLVTRFAPGGVLDFPDVGDLPISVLGFVSPGQTRYYAARYRDSATFCTSATFNITNTVAAYWRP